VEFREICGKFLSLPSVWVWNSGFGVCTFEPLVSLGLLRQK
jgi:hypothetical protein